MLDHPSQVAFLLEESSGGIQIRLRHVSGLAIGQPVRLLYRGVLTTGLVRCLEKTSEDELHAGIQLPGGSLT